MTTQTEGLNAEALERLSVEDIESLRWIADHQPRPARDLINRLLAERAKLAGEVEQLKAANQRLFADSRATEEWRVTAADANLKMQRLQAKLAALGRTAPAQDVAGLVEADRNWLCWKLGVLKAEARGPEGEIDQSYLDRINRLITALTPSPIQPQGEEL